VSFFVAAHRAAGRKSASKNNGKRSAQNADIATQGAAHDNPSNTAKTLAIFLKVHGT
jgi:hypothetical protein